MGVDDVVANIVGARMNRWCRLAGPKIMTCGGGLESVAPTAGRINQDNNKGTRLRV